MDGWIKILETDGGGRLAAVKYVNRRNIVAINEEGGRIVAVMSNGDTVGMPEMPPSEAKLPYDAEVDYLESTGTQYIDTGVAYDHTCQCALDFIPQSFGNFFYFGILWAPGASSTVRRWTVACDQYPHLYAYTTTNVASSVRLSTGVRYSLSATSGALTINGTTTNVTSSTFDPANFVNIYLFARHTDAPQLDPQTVTGPCHIKLYSFQIYKGGVLVRDFIPVRVGSGSSAVGYLHDRANPDGEPLGNGLYGNAADGQGGVTGFPANCIGPDKPKS